jgi:[histone H3]-lysine9 N-trimethyltransferase EHMT
VEANMTDLVKSLLSQMSSKFNESTNSELVKNLDYQEDKTLKWKTLINNTYAKKDREKKNKNRNKDGEDSVDDKPTTSSSPTPPSTDTLDIESEMAKKDIDSIQETSSKTKPTATEEKYGAFSVKETSTATKKIVIEVDDNLHSSSTNTNTSTHNIVVDDDEINISTNLPQLNMNSQAIESTKVTPTSSSSSLSLTAITDKKNADDNISMSNNMSGTASAAADDDKKNSKVKQINNTKTTNTIDKNSTSPRTLRSNKVIATSSLSNEKMKNESEGEEIELESAPKKGRGRPKLEVKMALNDPLPPATRQLRQKSETSNIILPKSRSTTNDSQDEKKIETNEEISVKKESETDETTPKTRRGRSSRKLIEEKDDKDMESQNSNETTILVDDEQKKKRGRLSKKLDENDIQAELSADNKSETNASDDVKPRLVMTINLTDKSAVMTTPVPTTTTTGTDDQEKIMKKRGRRPKATSISKPIQVKKSLRLAKDESFVSISEPMKKPAPALLPPVGRIRSQRRIKPTAKILANEELRQGFEATICKRLSLSNENLMESYERRSFSGNEKSSPAISSPEKSPKNITNKESSPEIAVVDKTNEILMQKLNQAKKPCRDPQEFINEIKTFKIGANRSPDDNKKLTKRQQRRLNKQKEKHLGMLGLKPKNGHTDSSDDTSTSEDFVPARSSKPRPPITIRLRNKKAEMLKRHAKRLSMHHHEKRMKFHEDSQQIEIEMSDDDDCIVVENNNKENNSIDYVCSCSQKTKYCISNIQNNPFSVNGKMFCCAIDEIETRKIGCTSELSESVIQLYRPSQKVSYMALCTSHRKRLASHNCCSGCGIFCTQGTFVICSNKHFFHRNCATKYILNAPYELLLKCPHCGVDAPSFDFRVTMRCENLPVFVQQRSSTVP